MKKLWIAIIVTFLITTSLWLAPQSHAIDIPATPTPAVDTSPHACGDGGFNQELKKIYDTHGESFAPDYPTFQSDPASYHFWAQDEEVTSQGKANERARQFISWVLNVRDISNSSTLLSVWNIARNISFVFILLMAAILGVGFIVGQRTNFGNKIKLTPAIMKIAGALLFVTFSAAIVLFMIQLSEILMSFFIENLGGHDLFNIYFAGGSSQELNYVKFLGCRDLNFGVQEAAHTQILLMKITNVTYYIMGVMLLLRKILLWFLLFVSPFLAILFPFSVVRNVGWIWIGVFFQWLFYGPLFALFLGGLATIWKKGIPFVFDFGRASTESGYIYPTAINILYGGPSQHLNVLNSGNYIDTFAEYVITLIMLWAVIFFPWWLLRYFRSYCCDGIYAMKNILLSMYDQMRNPPSPSSPLPSPASLNTNLNLSQQAEIPLTAKLTTIEEIKRSKTEEISRSLNLTATKLTDIARIETNKETRETIQQNIDYLSNPTKAATPTDRQKYMNLRTELFNRAIKDDSIAKQLLSATSNGVERRENISKIIQSTPELTPISQIVSYKVKISAEKVSSITNAVASSVAGNTTIVNAIAQKTQVSVPQTQTILTSYQQNLNKPTSQMMQKIATETGAPKATVTSVIRQLADQVKNNNELSAAIAQSQNVKQEEVQKIVAAQVPLVTEPEANIEQTISIPSTVSLEDYEEVKKMWIQQYERGEVPVSENLSSRDQWIEQDTILITNTLNKLVSQDEKLKQAGLDEIGFIIPIFMINNMKGEELLVYLKAKLEAAKEVKSRTEREKELTEKLKSKSEEVLVDVPLEKKEAASKTMTMEESLEIPGENKEEKKEQL